MRGSLQLLGSNLVLRRHAYATRFIADLETFYGRVLVKDEDSSTLRGDERTLRRSLLIC